MTGTEGDDVIVADSPTRVDALGVRAWCAWDDAAAPPSVDAGDGDHRVVVSDPAARQRISASLGTGTDEYAGGATRDTVTDDDGEPDDIRTGDGEDFVTLAHDGPVTETVHLGSGGGALGVTGTVSAESDLDGGERGSTSIFLASTPRSGGAWLPGWTIVNGEVDGTALLAGAAEPLRWRRFGGVEMDEGVIDSFTGSPLDDRVAVGDWYGPHEVGGGGIHFASMGGGDDYVFPLAARPGEAPIRSYGGPGVDTMRVDLYDDNIASDTLVADLRSGLFTYNTRGPNPIQLARVTGMQVYDLDVAISTTVTGSDRAETIITSSCYATVKAGAGNDTLRSAQANEYCREPV